ncbi:MAG TPA: HAD family hydrolase [bacterium]|nr:HAD family hydrolase [bacterium]
MNYSKKELQSTRFIPGSSIEIIRDVNLPSPPEHALFDFDGTISLIREGWTEVMSCFMVEILRSTGTNESDKVLHDIAIDFINETTGIQSIYQMIRLADEVKKRGAEPEDPLIYKYEYNRLLLQHISERCESLRLRKTSPENMMVPFVLEMLSTLREHGVKLYLASGTDIQYVRKEAQLLGVDTFFGNHIYGAVDMYRSYSKKNVIDNILSENKLECTKLIGFGDGFVEIENVKSAGGTAIAVASDESGRSGKPDQWKRNRLIKANADIVISDFRDYELLVKYLWNE